jgi:hypothetical protein
LQHQHQSPSAISISTKKFQVLDIIHIFMKNAAAIVAFKSHFITKLFDEILKQVATQSRLKQFGLLPMSMMCKCDHTCDCFSGVLMLVFEVSYVLIDCWCARVWKS